MTDQQINQAIAKACGWRKEDGVYMWTVNRIDCTCPELWDWCNDLNAMHDAEKYLPIKKILIYFKKLEKLNSYWFMATARERAEAFLKAMGKWEEVQG